MKKITEEHDRYEKTKKSAVRLTCRKVRGSYQYFLGKEYISKINEHDMIKDMAHEEYLKKLIPLVKRFNNHLSQSVKLANQIENAYHKLHKGKQILFEPEIVPVSDIISAFENETYVGLGFEEDVRTEFYTNKGERVRSKSEKIIADALYAKNIPYKYECPVEMEVDGKRKLFYPDFTALNRTTGERKYIEHLGMMDNPGYFTNALSKLDVFEKNGLLVGKDVLLFHETSYRPLNTRIIDKYIDEFLV